MDSNGKVLNLTQFKKERTNVVVKPAYPSSPLEGSIKWDFKKHEMNFTLSSKFQSSVTLSSGEGRGEVLQEFVY